MQELNHGSRWLNMVQRARGPWHILHKRHGPQTPIPSHRVMFGPSHRRCGGCTSINEDPLQRHWRYPAIYKRNGSSAAKIQACKTRHPWRVYAGCGAKIAASVRWVWNGDTGVFETPGRLANQFGMENDFSGGVRCEETRKSCPGRRRKTFWRFCSIRGGTWET